MNPKVRTVAQAALWFGAVNFGALVIAAATLVASGTVTPARWAGAMRVLWGTSEAVAQRDLAALKVAARREEERRLGGTELDLVERWRELGAEKERIDARAAELRRSLEEIRSQVEAERERLEGARTGLKEEIEAEKAERFSREAELAAFASDRIRRIYRYMRPAAVAADLDARMQQRRGEEVAAILKKLPERTVAEILEAMADPAKRNKIYDLMRTPVGVRAEANAQAQGEVQGEARGEIR